MKKKNARFWVFVNGDAVKITLRPGQSLSHATWSRHEEGWSSSYQQWELLEDSGGQYVERQWGSDGVDCDGRMSTGGEDYATLDNLATVEPYGIDDDRVMWPSWNYIDSRQRDYAAEEMGY